MIVLSIDVGIKNLAIVKMKIEEREDEINVKLKEIHLIDLCRKKKVKETKFNDRIKNLIEELDAINTTDINKAIIENPPSLKNPELKSIGVALYTYFMIKKIETLFVSPSNKLTRKENKELNYRQRKLRSIEKVQELMKDKDFINRFGKADDWCDCVNQVIESYDIIKMK